MTDNLLGKLTDVDALKRLLEAQQSGKVRRIDPGEMSSALRSRVKGQDHVVDDLVSFVRRRWAREVRDRPIASLVFLGPTGTGKTELAKAMTEYLYEREDNMIRVDGSDFKDPNNATKLTGQAGVYSNSKPGIITQPVANNPRRLILFDEIEKAWDGMYDIFLTMMGEGRLTDQNTGRVADYTQSIIILTSNQEHDAVGKIQEQIKDPDEMNNAVKQHLRDVKAFRPEIIGRFDRVYVFKPLEGMVIAEITALKMVKCAKAHGLELLGVHPQLIFEAMQRSAKVKDFGIRELDRIVDNILDEPCMAAKEAGARKIRLDLNEDTGDLVVNPAG